MQTGKIFTLLSVVTFLFGCSTTTKVDKINPVHQPNKSDCEIAFHKDTKPLEPYAIVGKIESHIKKNLFFGGTAELEDEAYKELRLKACELGGNSVVIDDYVETAAAEMSHVHVWATVLKLPK